MNLDDFSTVVDDRRYINPQVSLDEQNAFINNLRSTQQARNEEIATDTYNLGTAVPSNLGGLGGSGSYFNARYQTPQTNAVVADLRAAAQAQALNDVMNNELAQAQRRYSNAYKAAQKRTNSNPTTTDPGKEGGTEYDGKDIPDMERPDISDYISDGYNFSNMGNLFGESKKYPLTVDTPTTSTSYYDYTRDIKDPQQRSRAWLDYLDSIGYGG